MAGGSNRTIHRFSAVLTGFDGEMRFYASRREMPSDLRRRMDEALHGDLTASIVLADEGGQDLLKLQNRARRYRPNGAVLSKPLARRLVVEAAVALTAAAAIWVALIWR